MWTKEQLRWLRIGGWAVLGLVLVTFLYRVRTIFPIFLLGFFIAYLLDPLADRLVSRGYSRWRAVQLVFMVFFLIVLLFLAMVGPVLVREGIEVVGSCTPPDGRYYKVAARTAQRLQRELEKRFSPLEERIPFRGREKARVSPPTPGAKPQPSRRPSVEKPSVSVWKPNIQQWVEGASSELGKLVLNKLKGFLTSLVGLVNLIILPIITYYFLLSFDPFVRRLTNLVPEQYRKDAIAITQETGFIMGRYIRGYMVMCLCVGVVDTLLMMVYALIFKMEHWLVLGVLAGLTYSIPVFGALLTSLTAAIVSYATSDHHQLLCMVLVLLTLTGVNMFFDYVVTPRAVGAKIGLSPLLVIFAVMAGGVLFGVIGMLVAVPLAGSVKLLLVRLFPQVWEESVPEPQTRGAAPAKPSTSQPTALPNAKRADAK